MDMSKVSCFDSQCITVISKYHKYHKLSLSIKILCAVSFVTSHSGVERTLTS